MTISSQTRALERPYWERTVEQSRFMTYTSELERELVVHASQLAGPPTVALDMGCEGGRYSQILADRGWSMICADINAQALEVCQRRIPTARCVLLTKDNHQLPCADASLGILLCIECPVMPTDWFALEATRALRTGGVLVGVFFNKLSWRGAVTHTRASLQGVHDYYSNSYLSWRKALRAQGFDIVREMGCRWPPFALTSNSTLLPWALTAERHLGLQKLPAISPVINFIARKR